MRVRKPIAELAADVKRVVIVGGGYMGTTVAKQLDLMDGFHVVSFACSSDYALSVSISVALTDHSCSLWIFTGTDIDRPEGVF
jgi:predicted homoserine dehydrogenase-like protein